MKEEMLSPYSQENAKKFGIKTDGMNKLAPNLMSKKNYVVHYRNLQYYLSQGLILKELYRILQCKQRALMKPYIDFDTQKRKGATRS